MKAKLIAVTKPVVEGIEDAKQLIAYCARVSNPSNQLSMDTADKLLKYLTKHKHWSPLEMANAVVEVEAPRDIARQLLRHRSFSFQEFCVSGDSLISMVLPDGKIRRKPIKELYRLQESCYASRANWGVRIYNEETKLLEVASIKEVFSTGVKPCFRLTLENSHSKKGKSIVATKEHKFLTHRGWKRLEEITKDDFVAENGVPVYQDRQTVRYKKVASIEFVGDVETYDMEINASSHNYVANGIVTHNSQRYADVSQLDNSFCLREARMQDDKNRQNSVEIGDETEDDRFLKSEWLARQQEVLDVAKENYLWALNAGLAKEVARVILPEGLTMSRLYVNGTIRSWIHYLEVRTEDGVTQKEHVVLARLIAEQISKAFPLSKGCCCGAASGAS